MPLTELHAHQRNLAMGYTQIFSKFAMDVCGCDDPGNRIKLRKAVWLQTTGQRLTAFHSQAGVHVKAHLQTLAEMECAVQLLSKSSSVSRDESSPSKIILASKLLRSHLDVNEATVCRGCSKRNRCPFVRKLVPNSKPKTSLGAVTKILYGVSQSCRLFLKDSDVYPFVLTAEQVEAAAALTDTLGVYLGPTAAERQLQNVSVADRRAVKAIVAHQIKKNKLLDAQREKARKAGVPLNWVPEAVDANAQKTAVKKGPKFDINSDEWIAEDKEEKLSKSNLVFSDSSNPAVLKSTTNVDALSDIPIPRRPSQLRKEAGRTKKSMLREKAMIDLTPLNGRSKHEPEGGYMVGDKPVHPTGGVEYIRAEFLKGKTVLDNVSLASKLWDSASPGIVELKFLTRVPFQDKVPESPRRVTDASLAKVLSLKDGKEEQVQSPQTPNPSMESDRFEQWKARKVKIGILDRRVDGGTNRRSFGDAMDDVEIVTLKANTKSLSATQTTLKSNQEALAAAGSLESHEGKLKFPKLPQWDPALLASQKTPDGKGFAHLMRPVAAQTSKLQPVIDGKSELARSAKGLRRAAKRRPAGAVDRVVATSPTDLAGGRGGFKSQFH